MKPIEKICDPITLAANYLDLIYQGKYFIKNDKLKTEMLLFILERLDEEAIASFFQYQEKTNTFQILFSKNYGSAEIF